MATRGRPRGFDREAALERAMLLFWEKGYDLVSISQLTEAMGISPPSLYATFTDKHTLFEESVQEYMNRFGSYIDEELRRTSGAREAVLALLTRAAEQNTLPNKPAGCLIFSGATNQATNSADVASGLRLRRADVENRIATLIESDIATGALPHGTNPRSLATYVTVVWQGLSAAARDGHSRDELLNTVTHTMHAWP